MRMSSLSASTLAHELATRVPSSPKSHIAPTEADTTVDQHHPSLLKSANSIVKSLGINPGLSSTAIKSPTNTHTMPNVAPNVAVNQPATDPDKPSHEEGLTRWKAWCTSSSPLSENKGADESITPVRFLHFMEDVIQTSKVKAGCSKQSSDCQSNGQTCFSPMTLLNHIKPILLLWEEQYRNGPNRASSLSSSSLSLSLPIHPLGSTPAASSNNNDCHSIPAKNVEDRLGKLEHTSSSTTVAVVQLQEQVHSMARTHRSQRQPYLTQHERHQEDHRHDADKHETVTEHGVSSTNTETNGDGDDQSKEKEKPKWPAQQQLHRQDAGTDTWEKRATESLIEVIARGLDEYYARTRDHTWSFPLRDRSVSPVSGRELYHNDYRHSPPPPHPPHPAAGRFSQHGGFQEDQGHSISLPHGHKRSSSTLVGGDMVEGLRAIKQRRSISPPPSGYASIMHENVPAPFKGSPNATRPHPDRTAAITPESSNSSSRVLRVLDGSPPPRNFGRLHEQRGSDGRPGYSGSSSFDRLPPILDDFEHYHAIQSNISSLNRPSAHSQVDRAKYHHVHNPSISSIHSADYSPHSYQPIYQHTSFSGGNGHGHRRTHSRQQYSHGANGHLHGHHRRYSSADEHKLPPNHYQYDQSNPLGCSPPPAPPPIYVMNRQVNTVPELWKEWTIGLGPGNPSIRQLEIQYGPSWRTTSSAANFFSRRLRIINEVQRMIDVEGMTEEEAVNRLEMKREQGVAALNADGSIDNSAMVVQGGMSLHRLSEILRKKQL